MESELKKILKAVTLELRHLLEGRYDSDGKWKPGDLEQRLAAIGVRRDRASVPVDELGHLAEDDRQARKVVDAYSKLRDEAGVERPEAVAEFVRETAYTWANRLLALRCMEARELIDSVILQQEAYGGRSLEHHRLAQRHPELCTGDDDGLFAVLDKVFRAQAGRLPMLFDPQAPGIALRPSAAALKDCFGLLSLNPDTLRKYRIRLTGDETVGAKPPNPFTASDSLGWAYQYWNTEEKDRVFEKVRTVKGAKIAGGDIIPATQLYTEDYMVKFLVQNSLGATWMGMHPESMLTKNWEYYVKDADRAPVQKKPVREITFLDPACGSGHFHLEAFDLLYAMYQEEGELTTPEEICNAILTKNLFGIDIDPRAVQIAEVALWMKAAERAFDYKGVAANLVAATPSHLKGEAWEEFLAGFEREPSVARVLRQFANTMEHIDEIGSLARPDEDLRDIIKEEHATWERQVGEKKEANYLFPEMNEAALSGQLPFHEISDEDFGDRLFYRAKAGIDAFTEQARAAGEFEDQMLGSETRTGFRLVDLLSHRYDVVAANPPYMGSKNMGAAVLAITNRHYSCGKRDLGTAFFVRCGQLARSAGRVAIILQDSWMFLWSFEQLRTTLLQETLLEAVCHIGPRGFSEVGGEVVSSVMLVHRYCPPTPTHRFVTIALTDGDDSSSKAEILHRNVSSAGSAHRVHEQRTFARISGSPLVYTVPTPLLLLLCNLPVQGGFKSVGEAKTGMVTGNNGRFLRFFWEVGSWIDRLPYAKGQGAISFCDPTNTLIDWRECAKQNYRTGTNRSVVLSGQADLFVRRPCISYSVVAARRFSARVFPGGVFDSGGSCLFFQGVPLFSALTIVNSAPYRLILRCLNPTLNYQPVDFGRLPWPAFQPDDLDMLDRLGKVTVCARSNLIADQMTLPTFSPDSSASPSSFREGARRQWETCLASDAVYVLCRLAADWIVARALRVPLQDIYRELGFHPDLVREPIQMSNDNSQVLDSLAFVLTEEECEDWSQLKPIILAIAGFGCQSQSNVVLPEVTNESQDEDVDEDPTDSEFFIRISGEGVFETTSEFTTFRTGMNPLLAWKAWQSAKAEVRPVSLQLIPFCEAKISEFVLRLLGHRWSKEIESGEPGPDWADPDGIIPLTPIANEATLFERVQARLSADEIDASDFAEVMGKSLDGWLATEFFKHHTKQFKKRPIGWQLQSGKFTARTSPAFACLLYYHKLDADTLPKLRSQYVGPLRQRLETERRGILAIAADARSDRQEKRRIELDDAIRELIEFDSRLEQVSREGFASHGMAKLLATESLDRWCSLDGKRPPPTTKADLIVQESAYAPDINDGVRVNIAPLQKAGLLAAEVLAKKDVDKAIAERAQWRADERRWVREGKLTQPGWWPDGGKK